MPSLPFCRKVNQDGKQRRTRSSQPPAFRYDPANLVHIDAAYVAQQLNVLDMLADQLLRCQGPSTNINGTHLNTHVSKLSDAFPIFIMDQFGPGFFLQWNLLFGRLLGLGKWIDIKRIATIDT